MKSTRTVRPPSVLRYAFIAVIAVLFVGLSIVFDRTFVIDEADWNGIVELPGDVMLPMVKVKAGSFVMSEAIRQSVFENRTGMDEYEVPHPVTLKYDYYIGMTEVTQAQWRAVMHTDPSEFKGDDLPVEMVNWYDAMAFCDKLNEMGKAPRGWRFTLPTETQWEYAARGGEKSRGCKYSGSNDPDEVAWYSHWLSDMRAGVEESWKDRPHPVGRKAPNELGLYDMSGNVYEWCLDDWRRDSSKAVPEFTRKNELRDWGRVIRGGAWRFSDSQCSVTNRDQRADDLGFNFIGFRLALVSKFIEESDRSNVRMAKNGNNSRNQIAAIR